MTVLKRAGALCLGLLAMFSDHALMPKPAEAATEVQEVVSDGGVRAYLVSEPAIPFLSLNLAFKRAGSATDPKGEEGLAYMVSGLLDEGAGPYDSQAFRGELDDNAITLSFDADRDGLSGELKTLSETREHAFDLLRLALSEPRFDAEPVERVRGQVLAEIKRYSTDPRYLASRVWFEQAFKDHPYGRPSRGTEASVGAIDVAGLKDFAASRLAKDNLFIGVAGDITADALKPLLDEAFGGLPATSKAPEVANTEIKSAGPVLVERLDIPQSVVMAGKAGIPRQDPDYYAAYVANYILGGGGFSSRLMEEIREKRGLAYGAYSYLYDLDHGPVWVASVATRNDAVAESVRLIRQEMARMAAAEVGEEDLKDAKTYLTGSFPLRLTSNSQVAGTLVAMQTSDLGRDYLDKRNGYIEAVTLDDVKRVAKRLFEGDLLVSVVGDPVDIDAEDVKPVPADG